MRRCFFTGLLLRVTRPAAAHPLRGYPGDRPHPHGSRLCRLPSGPAAARPPALTEVIDAGVLQADGNYPWGYEISTGLRSTLRPMASRIP